MKSIQAAVKALRGYELSQAAIGKIAKVSQMTISRWEKAEPTLTNTKALNRMNAHLDKLKAGNGGK